MNDTERSFRAIYSLGESDNEYTQYALFPYVFKLARYNTTNLDNLDLVKKSGCIKDSKELSDLMFHKRNDVTCQYDEDILNMITIDSEVLQYMCLNLKDSNYTYAYTFRESYSRFTFSDYDNERWNDSQKQIITDYDNSTLYND